ncbi:hypothetical protein AB0P21_01225 [Kribbella sp. NPDC056861]|uniref:hypothetical protein n=1 Tax=Kribbella sp. NPDC056861 TaxID=3154857 RepID=UPI00342DF978
MLYGANPEQLPIMGLPFWYLLIADDKPANHCLDAALTLQTAYAMDGIDAVPAPAELAVPAQDGGTTLYSNPDPRIEDDLLIGHAGLWLPQSQRFVDSTVQQFPELRELNPTPVFLPCQHDWDDLLGHAVGAICGRTQILYRFFRLDVLDDAVTSTRRRSEELHPGGHFRNGVNLATNFLDLLRRDPDHRAKVLKGHYPELIRLVTLVGDDEIFGAEDDNLRIRRADGRAVLLDELAARAAIVVAG